MRQESSRLVRFTLVCRCRNPSRLRRRRWWRTSTSPFCLDADLAFFVKRGGTTRRFLWSNCPGVRVRDARSRVCGNLAASGRCNVVPPAEDGEARDGVLRSPFGLRRASETDALDKDGDEGEQGR